MVTFIQILYYLAVAYDLSNGHTNERESLNDKFDHSKDYTAFLQSI